MQTAQASSPWGAILSGLPWMEIFAKTGQFAKQILFPSRQGLYEVLEYESTLELLDRKGEKAIFKKRQKVRYLQDNIIAYMDQAWGDGKFLLDYRCTPGTAVDRYRFGHKTYILISLREVKQRGDTDEFLIERKIKNGFLRQQEQWETDISHPTRQVSIKVILPKQRSPMRVALVENTRQKTTLVGDADQRQLPDGRWQVAWKTDNPRLNERYVMKWEW
jgi:hypothetical protein